MVNLHKHYPNECNANCFGKTGEACIYCADGSIIWFPWGSREVNKID